jgi:hypothetical protein
LLRKRDENEEVHPFLDEVVGEYSFDGLAKGLADDALSRGQALKLLGGTILGAVLAVPFWPKDAEARRLRKKRHNRHHRRGVRRALCPTGIVAGYACAGPVLGVSVRATVARVSR